MTQFVLRLNLSKKARGYTNETLAEKLDVSPGTMRNYMSGRTEMPTNIVSKFSELLDVNVDWLMTGNGNMEASTVSEPTSPYNKSNQSFIDSPESALRASAESLVVLFNQVNVLMSKYDSLERNYNSLLKEVSKLRAKAG